VGGSPTIGRQTAAIMGSICLLLLLAPLVCLVVTGTVAKQYFGTNGMLNNTSSQFQNNIYKPLNQQANSTSGFKVDFSLGSTLQFLYGALGLMWDTLTNTGPLLTDVISGAASPLVLLPSLGIILSLAISSYILIGNVYKFASMMNKVDTENVGG
jgi:hypothetical protein